MRQPPNQREWFKAVSPLLVVGGPLVLGWIGLVNVGIHRSLGVTSSWPSGQRFTLTEEWLRCTGLAVPYVFIAALPFLAFLFLARRAIRWWAFVALLAACTPAAFYGGQAYARHLWNLNEGGAPWELILPVTAVFVLACLGALLLDSGMDFLRRRLRKHKGQCIHCAYDLRGSAQTGSCPECGQAWSQ